MNDCTERHLAAPHHGLAGEGQEGTTRKALPELTSFIAGLPKAELHVHHVGSASPRIVAELAARAAEAVTALSRGDISEFKRARAYLQSKIGHLRS